jgi:hypothetical protein
MKATDMLNKVKEVLRVELSEEPKEVKLAQAELENGAIIESENFEAGNEIFIVTEDEKVAMPVGEYKLVDGESLIVEEEGIIASIGAAEEEEVEAEKEEMNYATKEELQEVKEMVEEIKSMLEPKEEEMAEEPVGENSVKSEETTTKTVYAEKEELSEPVQKVTHNPEKENKPNLNLYSQKRGNTTLDRVLNKISNFK